jgi:hypothetical protein
MTLLMGERRLCERRGTRSMCTDPAHELPRVKMLICDEQYTAEATGELRLDTCLLLSNHSGTHSRIEYPLGPGVRCHANDHLRWFLCGDNYLEAAVRNGLGSVDRHLDSPGDPSHSTSMP